MSASAISSIIETRELASRVVGDSLKNAEGLSEAQWRDILRDKLAKHKQLYASGWYDPPPGGISILIGKERMGYDSIRKPEYWPRADVIYHKNSPAMIYVSPVDRASLMFGDFGLTIYEGPDPELQEHFKKGLQAVLNIAEQAQVGMKFSQLYEKGCDVVANLSFTTERMSMVTSNAGISNFGHTVPWSDGEEGPSALPMEGLKEKIRTARRFINSDEQYEIPPTVAFTVESRLLDAKKPELPNIFFHVIVAFVKGQRSIIMNFEEIFRIAGMDYML